MEFAEVVRKRRMVRRFAQRPVPPELIDQVLDQARRSPSAGFSQGVDFLVLDSPEALADFRRLTEPPEAAADDDSPPVIVLPIADKRPYLARYSEPDKLRFGLASEDAWPVKFWEVDASMAAMTALLAGVDAGLGTFFFGLSTAEQYDAVCTHFGVPDGARPIGVIAFGYRADDEAPIGSGTTRTRRPLSEQVHRNRW